MSDLNYSTVAVFSGSRFGNDPVFRDTAEYLGHQLGRRGIHVIYGGGNDGLMGVFAKSAADAGAHVTGVIPTGFIKSDNNAGRPRYTQVEVEGQFERKKEIIFRSDIMFGLPGGVGTFDEKFETLAFNDVQKYLMPDAFVKPLIVVNVNGHFNGTRDQLDAGIKNGFMDKEMLKAIHWARCGEEAMDIFHHLQYQPRLRAGDLKPAR